MEIKHLCDLLEVKESDKEEVKTELVNKLGPIIQRFNVGFNASISALKDGRSYRDLEYLKEKGLLKFHAERIIDDKAYVLYKLTEKGVEAYQAYDVYSKCA